MPTEPLLPDTEIDRPSDWPEVLASVREYWSDKRLTENSVE